MIVSKGERMRYGESWRSHRFEVKNQPGLTDIYEFGVFSGNSMAELIHLASSNGIICERLIGFDSFEGIPKETAEPCYNLVWDPDVSTYYKAFNSKVFFNVKTVEAAMGKIRELINPYVPKTCKFDLVPGFYDKSLTDKLPAQLTLGKAIIVDIDVDIYSSAKTVLHWLFRNKLVDVGTYFFYDDWGGTPGYRACRDGESRAHKEISEEFNVKWKYVTGTGDDSQIVWQVESIG